MKDVLNDQLGEAGRSLDNFGEIDFQERVSIMVTASVSPKAMNQDYDGYFQNEKANFSTIMVADGIGSYENAQEASKLAVEFLISKLSMLDNTEELNLEEVFYLTQTSLMNEVKLKGVASSTLGTTLITLLETKEAFTCAYVGNGAIWHIKGDLLEIPRRIRPIPWNAMNYLSPHSIMNEAGKEALTRYLSNDEGPQPQITRQACPSIFTIKKDQIVGDCIIIMTDGIYSEDQINFGYSPERDLLFITPPSLILLFQRFEELLTRNDQNTISQKDLAIFLKDFLNTLEDKDLLTDDATIGICMTSTFAKYHQLNIVS